jgi:hypothetical protein
MRKFHCALLAGQQPSRNRPSAPIARKNRLFGLFAPNVGILRRPFAFGTSARPLAARC